MKRKPNKAESDHIAKVVALGCLIDSTPAVPHHVRRHGEKKDHFKVIPLCPWHHTDGPHGEAVHQGRETWEENHGSELEHLDAVNARLGLITIGG